jgi:2'-5' RNA ligase
VRVFLAVELPAALRERLAAAAEPLLAGVQGARQVVEENLHVTLRFLGEVEDTALQALLGPLAAAAGRVPAGTAQAEGWGAFPSPGKPRVVWCGITRGRERLEALEREVSAAIAPHGFPPEGRAYHPHITVARVRPGRGRGRRARDAELAGRLEAARSFGDFGVSRLTVFRSHLSPSGARYEGLHGLPLGAEPATNANTET